MKASNGLFTASICLIVGSLTFLSWMQHDSNAKSPLAEQTQASITRPAITPFGEPSANNHLTSLQQEMESLREAISVLVENQSMTQDSLDKLESAESDHSIKPTAETPDNSELSPELQAQQEALQMQTRFQALEQTLNSEATDTEWAGETLGRIESSLQNPELQGFAMVNSACGSTLCKLEMTLPSDQEQNEAMQKLSAHRGWDGPTVFEVNAQGQAVFYIARNEQVPMP